MNSEEIKINKLFLYWLTISLFLVLTLIIVGDLQDLQIQGFPLLNGNYLVEFYLL